MRFCFAGFRGVGRGSLISGKERGELDAAVDTELAVDVAEVVFDGFHRHEQESGD